jgi:diguanylate cyclase (GGDEF)-like protein/PAS domain S-box-containing protein
MEKMEGNLNHEGEPTAQPDIITSDNHFRSLFEFAPISLWEEDYSQIRRYLDTLRLHGIPNDDLYSYIQTHPEVVSECASRIRVINVNRKTLEMYGAASKQEIIANMDQIFSSEMEKNFAQDLVEIWNGKYTGEREGVNHTLDGNLIDINLHWTILPGHEETLSQILFSMSDITEHKKAERYLSYLGTHDILTGLYNRAYLEEERSRLEESRRFPISVIIADLNGLKLINDQYGHSAGDEMLRRVAEVFKESFRIEDLVARIGGDEFAVILPETNFPSAEKAMERLRRLVDINNTFYLGPQLSISIGAATGEKGASLSDIQRQADDAMYHEKRLHYRYLNRFTPGID